MQQYDDAPNEEPSNSADGAMNGVGGGVGGGEDTAPPTPRHDKPPNSLSAPLTIAGNGANLKSSETDDDDEDADDEPSAVPRAVTNGSGYWRQGVATSRAASPPGMGDNISDVSSMTPALVRPKSRVELTASRYNNLSYWKARRVVFYRNGDPFFPGVEFRFKPGRDIVSLESLLDKLSLRMDLPRGARYVFSMDGDRKYRLDELEDGASYVVSSYKTFKVS